MKRERERVNCGAGILYIMYVYIEKIKRDFFTRNKNRRKKNKKSSKNIGEFLSVCCRKKDLRGDEKNGTA